MTTRLHHFRPYTVAAATQNFTGMQLLASNDPMERAIGADVLAQLGWHDRAFLDESVDALLSALADHDDSVVESVIFALGHRASPRSIPALLPFIDHTSADLSKCSRSRIDAARHTQGGRGACKTVG